MKEEYIITKEDLEKLNAILNNTRFVIFKDGVPFQQWIQYIVNKNKEDIGDNE